MINIIIAILQPIVNFQTKLLNFQYVEHIRKNGVTQLEPTKLGPEYEVIERLAMERRPHITETERKMDSLKSVDEYAEELGESVRKMISLYTHYDAL